MILITTDMVLTMPICDLADWHINVQPVIIPNRWYNKVYSCVVGMMLKSKPVYYRNICLIEYHLRLYRDFFPIFDCPCGGGKVYSDANNLSFVCQIGLSVTGFFYLLQSFLYRTIHLKFEDINIVVHL